MTDKCMPNSKCPSAIDYNQDYEIEALKICNQTFQVYS